MAKISYRPSPFAMGGALLGGIGEGLYMGQDIATKREANKQKQLHDALLMLAQGAKSDDPAMQQWFSQIAQQVSPQLVGIPMPRPTPPEALLSKDAMAQMKAAEQAMGRPLTEEEKQLLVLKKQPKEPKELVPFQRADGSIIMIDPNRAAQFETQVQLRNMIAAMKGSGGGGGGGGAGKISNMVNWHAADGTIIGQGPFTQKPPGAAYMSKISTSTGQEGGGEPLPLNVVQALGAIQGKLQKGEALTPEEQAVKDAYAPGTTAPGMGGSIDPKKSFVAPTYKKPPKKKGVRATAPPGMGAGTDEEPPE